MARVTGTEQTLVDLDAICDFIARDVPRYAEIFAKRAFETADYLQRSPLLGRVVPELERKDIREIIFGKYRIIYRVLAEEVEILTVYHGARLLTSLDIPNNT